jgi:hypothetical protein
VKDYDRAPDPDVMIVTGVLLRRLRQPLPRLPLFMCSRSWPLPSTTLQGRLVCPELARLRRHHRWQELPRMWTARQPSLPMMGALAIANNQRRHSFRRTDPPTSCSREF